MIDRGVAVILIIFEHYKRSSHVIKGIQIVKAEILGRHMWARGYWVASSGNVIDKVWKEYIKTRKPPELYDLRLG
ncbi:MAG: transposase [Candidatus Thiodiazotropha sp.]